MTLNYGRILVFFSFVFCSELDSCGTLLACHVSQSPSLVLLYFYPVPAQVETLAKECEILENTCLGTGGKQINSTPAENRGYMGEEVV